MATSRTTSANAVIVGCATGIGRALAEACVARGMPVALIDIDGAAIDSFAAELTSNGSDAIAITADISNRKQFEAAAGRAFAHFGTIDLVFLNAGIQRQGSFIDVSLDDHLRMLETNLLGTTVALHSFLVPMAAANRPGRIVVTGSACSVFVPPDLASYNASKGGILNLVETVHHELEAADSQLRLSVLLPGAVRTDLHDWRRYDQHENEQTPIAKQEEDKLRYVLGQYGMDPSELADVVFEAIADDNFWIVPHPDIKSYVRQRFDAFLSGSNPTLPS